MSTIVVGGGVSGIVAAYLLARQGRDVTLVERAEELGGLMRSVRDEQGRWFDMGTHFAIETGEPALDQILFGDLVSDEWWVFNESLPEGHYLNGVLNLESGCPDARTLPEEIFRQGVIELLRTQPTETPPDNAADAMRDFYGETFTQHLLDPIVRRLLNCDPAELHPYAHHVLSLRRLILFDSFTTGEIKQSAFFDAKVAHTASVNGYSGVKKYYPKRGGVGRWCEHLTEKAISAGVDIRTGAQITGMQRSNYRINAVELKDDAPLACDELVWTVPASLFLMAAGEPVPGEMPRFRDNVLLHYVVDEPIRSELHWVCCYESGFYTYRVTLYPNISREPVGPPPHHMTVEVLTEPGAAVEPIEKMVPSELVAMGLLEDTGSIVSARTQVLGRALPVPTNQLMIQSSAQRETADAVAENVVFAGRDAGAHFQTAILKDVYAQLA